MKFFKLFICCFLVTVISCSDSTGPGETSDGEILVQVEVGAAGGTVASDEIELTIPAGALEDEVSITLTTASDNPFGDSSLSGGYVIEGLPVSYSEEIIVSVACEGEVPENCSIALGVDTWVSSAGKMVMTYTMLPATVEGGRLTTVLPTNPGGVAKTASSGRSDESTPLILNPVKDHKQHVSAQGNFKISYHPSFSTQAQVEELGRYLEEAYVTIPSLGFSLEARTKWPVSVTVMELGDIDGGYSNSHWGDNYGYLQFNARIMSNSSELRITAGHEFFHLVQAFYDTRNFRARAVEAPPHLWLDEACAVWVEEKFSNETDYVSKARPGNVMSPFNGVIAGIEGYGGEHGYGLSGMIKFLVEEYGESWLVKTYEDISAKLPAMASVINRTDDPANWWEKFVRLYSLGGLYAFDFNRLVSIREGMFSIKTDSDTLKTFNGSYPDLSANVYIIRLDNPAISEDAVLSLSIDDGPGEVTMFKYRSNPFAVEFLANDEEEVTVSDLKPLTDGKWHILALVSNSRSILPYTENTDITLTVRVKKPINPGFNFFSMRSELLGDFVHVSYINSDFNKNYTSLFTLSFPPAGSGTLNGTTFTATRNQPYQDTFIIGTTTIEFDDTFENILSLEAVQTITHPATENSAEWFNNVSFKMRNIPVKLTSNGYTYVLNGADITDQVVSMTYEYGIVGDRKTTLVGYSGGGRSNQISVWLRIE